MADPSSRRKLAAILSADVVGYSRLMAANEAATVDTLKSYRDIITRLVLRHGGRVVNAPGSIVFHIAERHAGLLPDDADGRARAITWMFAALNTVEPPILEREIAKLLEGDKPWSKERLPLVGRFRATRVRQSSQQMRHDGARCGFAMLTAAWPSATIQSTHAK